MPAPCPGRSRSATWGGPAAHGMRPGAAEAEASSWQGLSAGSPGVCPSPGCICPLGLAVLFGSSSTSQCACTMGPGRFSPLCPFSQHCIALQCFPGIYQGVPSFPVLFSPMFISPGAPHFFPLLPSLPQQRVGVRGVPVAELRLRPAAGFVLERCLGLCELSTSRAGNKRAGGRCLEVFPWGGLCLKFNMLFSFSQ